MLNLHRDKKNVRREPGRDGKILSDHRQDGNDEVHRVMMRSIGYKWGKKTKTKKKHGVLQRTAVSTEVWIVHSPLLLFHIAYET